jgi:filamentous hemagglutinin family protein
VVLDWREAMSDKGSKCWGRFLRIAIGVGISLEANCTLAQITPDSTLPNNSSITLEGNTFNITGGTTAGGNLFHSFQEFSVPIGGTAFFNNSIEIQNIISRVTGKSISNIDGLLSTRGSANLFLINPNGIVFGPNARLDVGGSFIGTSANSVKFADGIEFNATPTSSPPLLTINVPLGLQFGSNPGEIKAIGLGHNYDDIPNPNKQEPLSLRDNTSTLGLQATEGKTIALLGGQVSVNGGILNTSAGRIEIGSVGSYSAVSLVEDSVGWRVGYEGTTNFGDIGFSRQPLVSTTGVGSGTIAIVGKNVSITEGSVLVSDTQGNRNPGKISIVGDSININQSKISTNTNSSGSSAQIHLSANKISVDNSFIATFTKNQGRGGNMVVNATDEVILRNSELATNAARDSRGDAGNFTLNTRRLSIIRQPELSSSLGASSINTRTYENSTGNAGDLSITASESVEINGNQPEAVIPTREELHGRIIEMDTGISTSALGTGNSGNLTVKTGRLEIRDNAGISTYPKSGQGGDVNIEANEIFLRGKSGIGTTTLSSGNAGALTISADQITMTDGAALGTNTFGSGDAGNFNLSVKQLNIYNHSIVGSGSGGQGNGASLTIDAENLIEVVDTGANANLDNSTIISVSAEGTGNAGNININTNSIFFNKGSIAATSASGEGGHINLKVAENLILRRNSKISTRAGTPNNGGGNGGDINIDAKFIVAFPQENSDITANAFSGSGGKVSINALGIFGIAPISRLELERLRPQDLDPTQLQTNDITTISQTNPTLSGTIELNTPDIDPNSGLVNLPSVTFDINLLQGCYMGRTAPQSEFTVTGRGGLPPNPGDVLTTDAVVVDLVTLNAEDAHIMSLSGRKQHHTHTRNQKTNSQIQNLQALAQVKENQAHQQLATAQPQDALNNWLQAVEIYEKLGDNHSINRNQINIAQAMQALGLYRQAKKTLDETTKTLENQPSSAMKVIALRSKGNLLRLTGELEQSDQILNQSLAVAKALSDPQLLSDVLLSLGNTAQAKQNASAAIEYYQVAASAASSPTTRIYAQTNQLRLLLSTEQFDSVKALLPHIQAQIQNLPHSRTAIVARINLAESLIKLERVRESNKTRGLSANLLSSAAQLLSTAVQDARSLNDKRTESYALGVLGSLYEQTQQWQYAQNVTQQALLIAQAIDAPDIAYQWEWQLGRLLKERGDIVGATAAYELALKSLESLRYDLVAINPEVQFSFREKVEPVYRSFVELLLLPAQSSLTKAQQSGIPQKNLQKARQTIESLQLAELNNFFGQTCVVPKRQLDQVIDTQDTTAAAIYPIILPDRVEVIIKLPHQPLLHYSTPVAESEVEDTLNQLRQNLIEPDTLVEAKSLSQKVYNWLIKPAAAELAENDIKTLVFVLDGALRNVPMAALYDGEQYLIEHYSVALTPGLQLVNPKLLQSVQLKAIAAGLSEPRQGFSALPNVLHELEEIRAEIPSSILLNQKFTTKALQNQINSLPFGVVHLATHGQFSSKANETFLIAWDKPIYAKELNNLVKTRDTNQPEALELLVLSACETAASDKRAALGIAGVAVGAGARSTIASLWSLDDESTAFLMSKFYQELASGRLTRAEALRRAQLALLHHPKFQRPMFWAPYILLGNWL